MKPTKTKLKQVIKEELTKLFEYEDEKDWDTPDLPTTDMIYPEDVDPQNQEPDDPLLKDLIAALLDHWVETNATSSITDPGARHVHSSDILPITPTVVTESLKK